MTNERLYVIIKMMKTQSTTMDKKLLMLQLIRDADNLAKATGMDFRLCLEILHKAGGGEQEVEPEQINNRKG